MDVRMFTVGPVQENAFLINREGSDRALIVDPGEEAPRLLAAIDEAGLTLDGILLTHTHFDHIGAVAPIARATGAVLHSAADTLPGVPRLTLHVGLPHTAGPEQIRDAVQSWLQRQARRVFEERCRLYAPRLGVRWTRLALSSAQTRWGSASADGSIRLNWRLIHFALPTIDYVVAHELAHLREMNHGPRFWDVVRSVIPDVDAARGTLRTARARLRCSMAVACPVTTTASRLNTSCSSATCTVLCPAGTATWRRLYPISRASSVTSPAGAESAKLPSCPVTAVIAMRIAARATIADRIASSTRG